LIIFQKKNLAIRGTPSSTPGGPPATQISISQSTSAPAPLLKFFAEVIDSSGISFSDLSLDGGGVQTFSGFGICPLGGDTDNPTHDITIERITASNFLNFFTLVGQTTGQEYLHGLSKDPSLQAVFQFTGPKSADPTAPHQFCSGPVQNVTFQNNTLHLKSVGFYAVPLTVAQSNGYGGLQAPFLVGNGTQPGIANGALTDWHDVLASSSSQNSGFYVGNNQFIVDIDPSFNGYQNQLDGYFHSMIKVQGTAGIIIENNTINAMQNTDVFAKGAALNIAFDNANPVIRGNQLIFPVDYKHPDSGIVVESGFLLHPFYGLGWLSYTQQGQNRIPMLTSAGTAAVGKDPDVKYGIEGLAGPSLGVQIKDNVLSNVFMVVNACCDNAVNSSNPILAWGDVTDFCRDMDAHQSPGDPKQDVWNVSGNKFSFNNMHLQILSGVPTKGQPAFVTTNNTAFQNQYPNAPFTEVEYCRQSFTWSNQNNQVCNAGGCQISTQ
jgi:hypothetical protein